MAARVISLLMLATALGWSDDTVRRALERLAQQAALFQRMAPDLVARETLDQRALKPVTRRFRPHLGATPPREPEWQTRAIVSEYGYATFDGDIREFRKPVSVDSRPLPDSDRALQGLAEGIRSGDERGKRALLENFEKLGLIGTITDFGQIILLFGRQNQDNFELQPGEEQLLGADRALTLRFQQTDGPPVLTVWRDGKATRHRVSGEILVRLPDFLPLRITVAAVAGSDRNAVREEATVEYVKSEYDVLVPAVVVHREFRAGQTTAENRFSYSPFRRFGSTSFIRFPNPGAQQ